jgi:carbamoyltransferase
VNNQIGFESYEEGKTMGLAAYGRETYVSLIGDHLGLQDDGIIRFDAADRESLSRLIQHELQKARNESECFQVKADFAKASQLHLQEALLRHAVRIYELVESDVLCVSGGVFMNCVANYHLLTESPFEKVFVHGAAGDNGTAVGAALYGYYKESGATRRGATTRLSRGREYAVDEVVAALDDRRDSVVYEQCDDVCVVAAKLLADGKIIGWFQGGSEFGARALGNRSILADPRDPTMRDRINARVKGREWFRPLAPSVLEEYQASYYDLVDPSPYMALSARVLPGADSRLPATTHVDGSARLQTVAREENPLYHSLIMEFFKLTGVPVVLNTSFNEHEPIVETPSDALECFLRAGLDHLVIGPFLVTKTEASVSRRPLDEDAAQAGGVPTITSQTS